MQAAIQSVLANQHSKFELIVLDQSTENVTEKTIQPLHPNQDGFRTFILFRESIKRDFYAIGVAHAKLAKRSAIKALPTVLYNSIYVSLWMPLAMIFLFKRPSGFTQFGYYGEINGFCSFFS